MAKQKRTLEEEFNRVYAKHTPRLTQIANQIDVLLREGLKISRENGIPFNLNAGTEAIRQIDGIESRATVFVPAEMWEKFPTLDWEQTNSRYAISYASKHDMWVPSSEC